MSEDERSSGKRIKQEQENIIDEIQYLQHTCVMEFATVEGDLHTEKALPITQLCASKQLKTCPRKRVPVKEYEVQIEYEQQTSANELRDSENSTNSKQRCASNQLKTYHPRKRVPVSPNEAKEISQQRASANELSRSENTAKRKQRPRTPPQDVVNLSAASSQAAVASAVTQQKSVDIPMFNTASGRSTLEVAPLFVDAGSETDDDDQPDEFGTECLRPPTLATDSPAILPDNINPRIIDAIKEMDDESDKAMRALLSEDMLSFDWRSDSEGFSGVREIFMGSPGPTFDISEMITPAHAFLKIWDQEIMKKIAEETNEYAANYLKTAGLSTHSRIKRWRPTTANELYVFFAVMMFQSLSPCTVEAEYFYPTSRITAMPFFKEYLSYNRLLLLKKFLHFANNSNIPDGLSLEKRRLYKIQPILDHLNQRFQNLYLPGQNVVIDDSLLHWHSHLAFVQKISTRVARLGIKSLELCDSYTGYLWSFIVYAGKDATTDRSPNQSDDNDRMKPGKTEYSVEIEHPLENDQPVKIGRPVDYGRLVKTELPDNIDRIDETDLKDGIDHPVKTEHQSETESPVKNNRLIKTQPQYEFGYHVKIEYPIEPDQTVKIDRINEIDKPSKTDQIDEINHVIKTEHIYETDRPAKTEIEIERPDKIEQPVQAPQPHIQTAATAKMVYDLARPLFHRGHSLIMDNFYNSPLLARCLKSKGTDCYGTLRLSRENVPSRLKTLTKTQLRSSEVVTSTSGDLNAMVWKDDDIVSMISTYHAVASGLCSPWPSKPKVVADYNKSMVGVGIKEQLLSNFPLERRKNSIWYKTLFRRLLNVSVQNAFILYHCKDKNITHRKFLQQVAKGLLEMYFEPHLAPKVRCYVRTSRLLPSTCGKAAPRPVLANNHYSVRLDHDCDPLSKVAVTRQCVFCSMSKKRSRTSRKCNVCDAALCIECMKPYHTSGGPP